jgi:DNA uptake protein ComE-like DNA-binding protein
MRRFLTGWLLGALALLAPAAALAQQTEETTPQGAATKICSACHTMQMVMDTPRDIDNWHETVQSMINRGARGTPEEFDLVMQFLWENVTPVDVNHADAETLAATLRASPAVAEAIIARRAKRPFKDLAELESAVSGLDRALLENKKRMIFFQ